MRYPRAELVDHAPESPHAASSGYTLLLVEQDVFAALSVADRGYALENGQIVHHGTAAALADDPEVKRAYLAI